MKIVRRAAEVREVLGHGRREGFVGFVPTMGALHRGHVALIEEARGVSRQLVISVFVNPTQFNDPADLAAYPRNEGRDAEMARAAGVDIFFAPHVDEIYPPGHATSIDVKGAALGFEGDHRPGHFSGVATVCTNLFNIVRPDVVFFGQKDAQQVAVIQQIVRDLHLGVRVHVVPTVRDPDGLALSSRNVRLSAEERQRALSIPAALRTGLAAHRSGGDPVAAARAALVGLDVDYVGLAAFSDGPTLVIAARAGATRLIDNVPVDHPERAGL